MSSTGDCLICKTPGSSAASVPGGMKHSVSCIRCGKFDLARDSATAPYLAGLGPHQRATLSGLLREHADRHPDRPYPDLLTAVECERLLHSGAYPLTLDRCIERILLAIAERAPFANEWVPKEAASVWTARAFLATETHLHDLLSHLANEANPALIKKPPHGDGASLDVALTFAGWQRVEQLRRTTAAGNQAFVAMWFHADMKHVYDSAILPAILDCGLAPYRVDSDGGNHERVDVKIVAEIRRSRVLIADATGERAAVYYEAGLADGLGIPVIWCCNRSWRAHVAATHHPRSLERPDLMEVAWHDRLNFDTRQFPHLLWDEPADLREKLRDTLRARGIAPKTA